jgi:hypothetical protein
MELRVESLVFSMIYWDSLSIWQTSALVPEPPYIFAAASLTKHRIVINGGLFFLRTGCSLAFDARFTAFLQTGATTALQS